MKQNLAENFQSVVLIKTLSNQNETEPLDF